MFHAFVVMSSHFFYVMKNLWTFFFSLFLLFDALVGHQALVKQNKGPRVRGGRAEHLRSTGLGGWRWWRYGFVNEWMKTYIHALICFSFVFPIESLLKNELKKNGMSFFTFFPFSEAKNSFGASKPCLVKRYMNWWFKWKEGVGILTFSLNGVEG